MDLISPGEIVRISHDEWTRDFSGCVDAINAGTIFLVYGNKSLEEIYRKSIHPRLKADDRKYFGPNPDDLYKKQVVQSALYSELRHEAPIFVDSYVRLRRTIGKGAFVGPHIDYYEDLPLDGINCWVSFSSLEASEAIQFLPAHYYPGGDMSGHFKAEVHLDQSNKLMPSSRLVKEAKSHDINPCEYFVFNSGRTVHCSPFYVKSDRVTCDQRVFLARKPEDANFGELLNYYSLEDMGRFDGSRDVASILTELWASYLKRFSFPICQFRADLATSPDKVLDIAQQSHIDPSLFLREKFGQEISFTHPLIQNWLSTRPQSVSLRMRLLDQARDSKDVNALCKDLLNLTPENPDKIYRKVFTHPDFDFKAIQSMGGIRDQSGSAETTGRLIRLLNVTFGRMIPGSLRTRATKKLALSLLKSLHPQIAV